MCELNNFVCICFFKLMKTKACGLEKINMLAIYVNKYVSLKSVLIYNILDATFICYKNKGRADEF